MKTIPLLFALLVLIGCGKTQTQQAKSDLTPQEQAMVGEWLAKMVVTDEAIDDYHAAYPEGDKDEVVRLHEEMASRPLYVLRLNEDRTVTHLTSWGQRAGPRDEDTKWRLSQDGKILILTQTTEYTSRTSNIVDGKEVIEDTSGTNTHDMEYRIAADGASFTDLPDREQRFLKKGSPEAKAAFRDPEPVEPIVFAINVTRDDYVGTWKLDLTPTGDPTAFRASMSEKEVDEIGERLASIDVRIVISSDGTWLTKGEATESGTWTFDVARNSISLSAKNPERPKSEGRLTKDTAYMVLFEDSLERRPGGRFKRMD